MKNGPQVECFWFCSYMNWWKKRFERFDFKDGKSWPLLTFNGLPQAAFTGENICTETPIPPWYQVLGSPPPPFPFNIWSVWPCYFLRNPWVVGLCCTLFTYLWEVMSKVHGWNWVSWVKLKWEVLGLEIYKTCTYRNYLTWKNSRFMRLKLCLDEIYFNTQVIILINPI